MPVGSDIQEGQFVRKRLDSVRDAAVDLYHRLEGSSPLMRKGLETLGRSTAWVSAPLVSTLSSVGPTVIDGLDNGLAKAYTTLDGRIIKPTQSKVGAVSERASAMSSKWYAEVNQQLKENVEKTRSGFSSLYQASVDAYVQLEPTTFDAFVKSLRSRLAKWDEAYVPLAKQFWTRAQEAPKQARGGVVKSLEAMKSSTLQAWDSSVEKLNANELYRSAVDHYLTYTYKDAEGTPKKVTVVELVDGMKQRLGSAWNQRLAKPLGELFTTIKTVAVDDLKEMSRRSKEASQSARSSLEGVRHSMQGFVHKRVDGVLQLSARGLDYLLPPPDSDSKNQDEEPMLPQQGSEEDTTRQSVTFTSLATALSKRLRKKATVEMGRLREFSASRGKQIIHVDLIQYAEKCIDTAASTASSAVSNTRSLATKANPVPHARAAASKLQTTADPHVQSLKRRLSQATERIRGLTQLSLRTVGQRKVLEAPRDVYTLCLKVVGLRERDPAFRHYVEETRDTVWAVVNVINVYDDGQEGAATLTDAQQGETGEEDGQDHLDAAQEFLRSAARADKQAASAQAEKLFGAAEDAVAQHSDAHGRTAVTC